jgi:central kinetochore subunit Mal2/MCM21
VSAQHAHNRENLYRACASITTFHIQDPDPNAVDEGSVLGIRVDVSSSGKFAKPYYVMLNKPFVGSDLLRIHRHTVPPCIPLASLAAQYLSCPKNVGDVAKAKKQDLRLFARSLRRELVSYRNRISVIKTLRKEFKLNEDAGDKKGKGREKVIVDISAADAEAKQVRIEWVDGRIGRCVVGDSGIIEKCVVVGDEGRDREVERRILGDTGESRMEEIGERLRDGIY